MNIVFYLISILMGIEGLINLCGAQYPLQQMGKYTDESLKKWLRPNGLFTILMAAGLALFNTYVFAGIKNMAFLIGGIALLVIGIACSLMINKKILVKK